MQQWEYLELLVEGGRWADSAGRGGPLEPTGAGRRWESVAPLLNELGAQGWRVAATLLGAAEHRHSSAEYRLLLAAIAVALALGMAYLLLLDARRRR